MKTLTSEELKRKIDNNEINVVDVLSEDAYKKAHIKGALNFPLKSVVRKANEAFEKDDHIAVYCSDEACSASPTAAKKLEESGFTNVYDFEGGKKAWKDAGYDLESN